MSNLSNITSIQTYYSYSDQIAGGLMTYVILVLFAAILFENIQGDFFTKIGYSSMIVSIISFLMYVTELTSNYSLWQPFALFAAAAFTFKAVERW